VRVALIGAYPVGDAAVGGAANVTGLLANGLRNHRDVELHVIAPSEEVYSDQRIDVNDMVVHAYRRRRGPAFITNFAVDAPKIVKFVQTIQPDVVHAQEPMFAWHIRKMDLPCVLTVHGMCHKEFALHEGFFQRRVDRFHLHFYYKTLRLMRHIIAISPYAEQELRPFTSAEFTLIPNPVRDELFKIPVEEEPWRILCVGSVVPRKATLELLRAFEIVCRRFPQVRLRIAGHLRRRHYVAQAKAYVAAHRLEQNVQFLGPVDRKSMLEEYQRCMMVVLMTRQETAPCVIAEAMAAAKPVVSTRICGIPYMVEDGRTGLLAAEGDVDGFAECVMRLLTDEPLRRSMGQAGRAKATAEYDNEVIVAKTVDLYKRVVQEHRSGKDLRA